MNPVIIHTAKNHSEGHAIAAALEQGGIHAIVSVDFTKSSDPIKDYANLPTDISVDSADAEKAKEIIRQSLPQN